MNINIKVKLDKDIKIIYKKNYISVYLKKELFLKQDIIKHTIGIKQNKDYTFFLVVLMLSRFGLVIN